MAAVSDNDGSASGSAGRSAFPAPITILLLVLVAVWVAAFFIPSGQYQLDPGGSPIAGSFQRIEPPLDFNGRVRDLLLAPVNGLYGIQDPASGQIGPFNRGAMFGSAQVFLFILAIGGFMTVVFATGALDRGIHHLAYGFRRRGPLLIAILSLLFGVLGSVMAWSDETLGLYALMVPLMIALGYDRMVTVAVVSIAPFVGTIGSTINPFVVGIGAAKAGVSIGDGIGLRLLLFALLLGVTIAYTLWYARRVKADPASSLVGFSAEDRKENIRRVAEVARLTFENGLLTLCAFISPYAAERQFARSLVPAGRFVEIYVRCDLEEAQRRDPKGLYARAVRGEIRGFTGVDEPYETPQHPELIVDTVQNSPEENVEEIVGYLKANNFIQFL